MLAFVLVCAVGWHLSRVWKSCIAALGRHKINRTSVKWSLPSVCFQPVFSKACLWVFKLGPGKLTAGQMARPPQNFIVQVRNCRRLLLHSVLFWATVFFLSPHWRFVNIGQRFARGGPEPPPRTLLPPSAHRPPWDRGRPDERNCSVMIY